jgi:exosome complex RNA-binding protein Rrp4
VLLNSPKLTDDTFKMNDASANIIKQQQRLSGVAARNGRVLLNSPKLTDDTFKMNDASANIIKQQQRLSGAAARNGRVLLEAPLTNSDRMTQNTIRINAAADLVHQATSRLQSRIKSRMSAVDAKAAKNSSS